MTAPSAGFAVLLAGGLATVHAFAGKLRVLRVMPRSQYLSLAGGVSVAYVFVHLLPEVTAHQAELADAGESAPLPGVVAVEQVLFTVALAGFAVFYGLEQLAVQSRRDEERGEVTGGTTALSAPVFWLHIGTFGAYNVLIGYVLLHREETGTAAMLLYFVAMALHFVVNDHGLREHHRDAYNRVGRWVLVGSILGGVLVGLVVSVREATLGLLLAFLAGGIILNVIKEELPEERESSVPAFAAGLVGYTGILLNV